MGNAPGTNKRRGSDDAEYGQTPGSIPPKKKLIVQPTQDISEEDAIVKILRETNVEDMSRRLQAATLSDAISGQGQNNTLPTVFKWEGGGKEVYISGTFNGWKAKIPMVKSKHNFYTIVDLPEGEHHYKFIVDGQWKVDTNQLLSNSSTTSNSYGTLNNVIQVNPTDFDVLDALLQDIKNSKGNQDKKKTGHDSGDADSASALGSSPPGEYSQKIPEKSFMSEVGGEKAPTPPLLPPQLLQVILNKDTGAQYDPNLLPQPNHVMVNHMYALSIKDGVIVLSAITRYRQKFVSTVIYKPI